MRGPRTLAEVLTEHGIATGTSVANFFRFHRGHQFAAGALIETTSKTFVAAFEKYVRREKIPILQFRKGQRKDDIVAEERKKSTKSKGVVFIGKA
jgi:hypothetical protein